MEESYVSQGVIFDILQYDCQQIQLLYGLYKHIFYLQHSSISLYGKLISIEYVLSRIYVINSCSVMFQ